MIALLPTPDDAQRYALNSEQAEPADQLHLTLQYLGDDVTGWDDDLRGRALTVAEKAVTDLGAPLSARVFGHATFNPDGHDDRDPCAVYLIGDTDLLGPLREKVSLACRALLGDQHPAQHEPFVAHMTAGQGLAAADLSEVGEVTFDRVGLFLGGERTELPLDVTESRQILACRAWARGYGPQPASEIAHYRFGAVYEAAKAGQLDPVGALADGATTAQVAAAAEQRQQVHDDSRDTLATVLAAFAAGVDTGVVRSAVQPDAPRATRRDQAAAALLGQMVRLPDVHQQWRDTTLTAHTLATTAGAAAGAHILTGGATPLEPAPPTLPNPTNPDPWIEREISGLGGDLAGVLAGAGAEDVADAALVALLGDGVGAQYYLDLLLSQTYLDGMTLVYSASGVGLLGWRTAAATDVCSICLGYEAAGPYTADTVPAVPHGGCRCQIVPWS